MPDMTFSVIIPVFNAADTITGCTDSVAVAVSRLMEIRQSEVCVGLILVDDGSSDGSGDICEALVDKYSGISGQKPFSEIKAIHQENGGVSTARNAGLDNAHGKYVTFVDADDTVSEDFFIRFTDVLEIHPDALLIAETGCITSDAPVSGDDFLENALLESDTHVWGKLFIKDMTDHIRFREGLTIGEDMLFLLEYVLGIGKRYGIICLDNKGYIYNFNENGAMLSAFKESYLDQLTCWQLVQERLQEERRNRHLSPIVFTKLASRQIMASFLVLGKLAESIGNDTVQTVDTPMDVSACKSGSDHPTEEDITSKTLERVKEVLKPALSVNGAFAGIPAGYKIKVLLYRISPELYLKMYSGWKKGKR